MMGLFSVPKPYQECMLEGGWKLRAEGSGGKGAKPPS